MPVDRTVAVASSSLVEILDRILDKGIVIDAWVRVSVIGIELLTVEARVIVASVETYTKYAAVLGYIGPVAGGIRAQDKKSLGEGLKDIQENLPELPLGLSGSKKESVEEENEKSTTRRGRAKATAKRKR